MRKIRHRWLRSCLIGLLALGLTFALPAACTYSKGVTAASHSEAAPVIYQAFNQPFREVQSQLANLKDQGYTHIQVSPPQKSNPATEWWGRYQPIDFTVLESPLGTEQDLQALIQSAHDQQLKILVDVVLNHMANYGEFVRTLNYPRFSPADFHPQRCIDYRDRASVIQGWLNCDLPDLKTTSDHVRQEARSYLKKLLALGADGFRFDAAKHIEPGFFQAMMAVIPPDKLVYGEVIGQTIAESSEYTPFFRVTDFHLLETMLQAFGYGGDLRMLEAPDRRQQALPTDRSITFANNHDIETRQIGYHFSDRQDTVLATAFVLAREEGLPFIYRDDGSDPLVQAGVRFHQQMAGSPQRFLRGRSIAIGADSPNLLFIRRGDRGIALFNKAGEPFEVSWARLPGLKSGCYQDLRSQLPVRLGTGARVTRWGDRPGGIRLSPRSVMLLVQVDPKVCDR